MSYRWPNKDPNETLDYSIDWSRILSDGDTISGVTWYVDDADGVKTLFFPPNVVNGLLCGGTNFNSTIATIILSAGTLNATYKLYCSATTTSGLTFERSIHLSIKDK